MQSSEKNAVWSARTVTLQAVAHAPAGWGCCWTAAPSPSVSDSTSSAPAASRHSHLERPPPQLQRRTLLPSRGRRWRPAPTLHSPISRRSFAGRETAAPAPAAATAGPAAPARPRQSAGASLRLRGCASWGPAAAPEQRGRGSEKQASKARGISSTRQAAHIHPHSYLLHTPITLLL